MTEPDTNALTGMSDDELLALEQDRSLPIDRWMAVEAERGRREAAARPDGAGGPPPEQRGARVAGTTNQSEPLDAALAQLRGLLVPGERLLAYAVQRRLFALAHRRVIVGATTGRVVALSRRLVGGYDLYDVRWQDLRDATVSAGIFGATLGISSLSTEDFASNAHAAGHPGGRVAFAGLNKVQAERVYAICQAQEQVWREKRRVRDLDELRAQSGGIQIGAVGGGVGSGGGAPAVAAAPADPLERLRRAKEMLDNGLISDTEYESIKARVVDGL